MAPPQIQVAEIDPEDGKRVFIVSNRTFTYQLRVLRDYLLKERIRISRSSMDNGIEDILRQIDKDYQALEKVLCTLDAKAKASAVYFEGPRSNFHLSSSALRSKLRGQLKELQLLGLYIKFINRVSVFYNKDNFLHGLQKLAAQCSEEFFEADSSSDSSTEEEA
ncbi:MAG: hypothetical protein Q9176_003510 [Flavoplaca citrina]